MAGTETFIESINIEIVLLRTRSEENTFYENPFYSRREAFYARSINVIVGSLPRAELHSRYNLQSKDALSVGRPWLPRSGAVSSAPSLTSPQRGLLLSSLGNPVKLLFFGMEEPTCNVKLKHSKDVQWPLKLFVGNTSTLLLAMTNSNPQSLG